MESAIQLVCLFGVAAHLLIRVSAFYQIPYLIVQLESISNVFTLIDCTMIKKISKHIYICLGSK
jgi:hypothetical protein